MTLREKITPITKIADILQVRKGDGRITLKQRLRRLTVTELASLNNMVDSYKKEISGATYDGKVAAVARMSGLLQGSFKPSLEDIEIEVLEPLLRRVLPESPEALTHIQSTSYPLGPNLTPLEQGVAMPYSSPNFVRHSIRDPPMH